MTNQLTRRIEEISLTPQQECEIKKIIRNDEDLELDGDYVYTSIFYSNFCLAGLGWIYSNVTGKEVNIAFFGDKNIEISPRGLFVSEKYRARIRNIVNEIID